MPDPADPLSDHEPPAPAESPAESDLRTEQNGLAFLGRLAGAGGYTLRAFSYYTLNAVQLLDLAFGSAVAWTALDADAQREQVNALLFIQGAPLPEVERAIRAYRRTRREQSQLCAWDDFLATAVAPFLASLGPDAHKSLAEQFEQMTEAGAAVVDARPPKSGRNRERLDPNS